MYETCREEKVSLVLVTHAPQVAQQFDRVERLEEFNRVGKGARSEELEVRMRKRKCRKEYSLPSSELLASNSSLLRCPPVSLTPAPNFLMSLWKIAWRSIQQRSLASLLTAISMALGVMLVVAVW